MSDIAHVAAALFNILQWKFYPTKGVEHLFTLTLCNEITWTGEPGKDVHLLPELQVTCMIIVCWGVFYLDTAAFDEVIRKAGQIVLWWRHAHLGALEIRAPFEVFGIRLCLIVEVLSHETPEVTIDSRWCTTTIYTSASLHLTTKSVQLDLKPTNFGFKARRANLNVPPCFLVPLAHLFQLLLHIHIRYLHQSLAIKISSSMLDIVELSFEIVDAILHLYASFLFFPWQLLYKIHHRKHFFHRRF